MKLQILSDLHREFYRRRREKMDMPWRPSPEADVIVLAGDIDEGCWSPDWLIWESEQLGKPIVYVPGNHEYYDGVIEDRLGKMREQLNGTQVHLLDCDEVVIKGVRFLGTTLWTDYKASVSTSIPDINLAMFHVSRLMNDHRLIRTTAGATEGASVEFTPQHALARHKASRAWLTERLAVHHDGPTVVVTHHGPGPQAQHRRYPLDNLSGAYWSDLTDLFSYVDLWVYGHTHCAVDTLVEPSGMRLVSNQAGYPHETGRGFELVKLVEV